MEGWARGRSRSGAPVTSVGAAPRRGTGSSPTGTRGRPQRQRTSGKSRFGGAPGPEEGHPAPTHAAAAGPTTASRPRQEGRRTTAPLRTSRAEREQGDTAGAPTPNGDTARERRPADPAARPSSPRRRPAPARADPHGGRLLRRLRLATAAAAALVLATTGTAWGLYRDVTAGITTTDVITAGGDGGPTDVLLVGVDSRTDAQGDPLPQEVLAQLHAGGDATRVLNSDTIILLRIPEDGGAAIAFSIPRDAYVDIPGYRRDKINSAYPAVQALTAERLVEQGGTDPARAEAEAAQAGRTALIEAVEGLTGVTVDHFAEVNLLGFHNLTRAIGGVDVCLKAPVDDPLSGARFPAGPRTIQGADALAFVRQRHGLPEGDLSRIRRQQVFLAAVAEKVLATGTLTDPAKLADLVGAVQRSVVLDRGFDLLAFARQASGIAAGDLEFRTVPTAGTETNARGSVVRVDPAQVRAFVEQRSTERDEAARAAREVAATAAPPPVDVEADHFVVHVRNGSGVAGLAARAEERLTGLGFVAGTVDNTADTPTSVVRHRDSDDAAESVAAQLGGIEVEQDDAVPSGHLQVVLGADAPVMFPGLVASAPQGGAAAGPGAEQPITAAGVPCVD